MKRIAAALCLMLLGFAASAATTPVSTDASDAWISPTEPGWGVSVNQQKDVLFLTMFVYAPTGLPTWYVGSNTVFAGKSGASAVYKGPLFTTSGSPHTASWNPGTFRMRQVGTVTFTLTSATTATIFYMADGARVTKNLVRQTWRLNDLDGQYIGAVAGTYSNCANTVLNGFTLEYATITVDQNGANFQMGLENSEGRGSCSYTGTYSQAGRLGSVTGSFICTGNVSGTFTASEVEGDATGFLSRLEERSTACNFSGRVGGVRATQ